MNVAPIIRRALASTDDLAKESGLSRSYVKHLSKPRNPQSAGAGARSKLASALRERGWRMLADAEALENGTCES